MPIYASLNFPYRQPIVIHYQPASQAMKMFLGLHMMSIYKFLIAYVQSNIVWRIDFL